jgi:hypothetical protein
MRAPSTEVTGPALHVVATVPKPGAAPVPVRQSIRIQFDRFLTTDAERKSGLCIEEGASGTCLDASAFQTEYDPVDRVLVWIPKQPLREKTSYTVRVLAAKGDADANVLRAFDDASLESEMTFDFTTGDATVAAAEPKRSVGFCTTNDICFLGKNACATSTPFPDSPGSVLALSCTSAGICHKGPPIKGISGLAVSFEDPDGGTPAAVRRLVEQGTIAPETATDPDPGARRLPGSQALGFQMPYIDRGRPGNSFALYKIILGEETQETATLPADTYACKDLRAAQAPCANDAGFVPPANMIGNQSTPIPGVAEPWMPHAPAAAGEIERLAHRVRGVYMPKDGTISSQEVHALSAWIAAGAPVTDCPQQ